MINANNITQFIKGSSDEFYPDEIASSLLRQTVCASAKEIDAVRSDLENALYNLKSMAENKYNSDYWRVLWNVLQLWAEQEIGLPF